MDDAGTDKAQPKARAAEKGRLDSWKKIAAHFNRDVTTVQRWERREGMPVHRHIHDKQGSVYAFRAELEEWWEKRRGSAADNEDDPIAPAVITAGEAAAPETLTSGPSRPNKLRFGVIAACAGVALLVYAAFRFGHFPAVAWRDPIANAAVSRLTDWTGSEQSAAISRDGRWAAFLADHEGHMDAWLTEIGSGSYRNLTNGSRSELINGSIRPLNFSADGSLVTIWTKSSDGSHADDIKLLAAPASGGDPTDFLPGVAEVAWSPDGKRLVYHTTAPGDPFFVRDAQGIDRQIYVAPAGIHCHFPVWSKDGAYIYFARGTPPDDWDIWRMRSSGAELERLTSHRSRVSHPVLIDERTLVYLASGPQGSGPWLYAMDIEQRVPHRISFGLERYTSLAASDDGSRLLATVNESHSSIWSAPLGVDAGASRATQPVSLVPAGLSPRTGPGFLLYVSARADRIGIWRFDEGQSRELWSDSHGGIVGTPAVSDDGREIAFTVAHDERTVLYTMHADGKAVRALVRTLDLRGSPAWAPDGQSIVTAVLREGEPRLMSIYLDGKSPTQLVSEYSIDPVWSPDGQFLIYSGADVGTTFPVRAVARDGRPYPIPSLMLSRGSRRLAFGPDAHSMVLLKGEGNRKNFWLEDLRSGAQRQITDLPPDFAIGNFDVARDGSSVVFDRADEKSRIALIQRGR